MKRSQRTASSRSSSPWCRIESGHSLPCPLPVMKRAPFKSPVSGSHSAIGKVWNGVENGHCFVIEEVKLREARYALYWCAHAFCASFGWTSCWVCRRCCESRAGWLSHPLPWCVADPDRGGIACRGEGGWRLEDAGAGTGPDQSEYRMAGNSSAELLERAQAMAAGPALDAAQERTARASGWR